MFWMTLIPTTMAGAAQPADTQWLVIIEVRSLDLPCRAACFARIGPLDVPGINMVTDQ
jgi:hypothetical protein